jgi:hypothetical protein
MRIATIVGIMTATALTGIDRLCAQTERISPPVELAQAGRGKSALDRKPPVPKSEKKKIPGTMINMELLTIGDGVAIKAREWMEVLGKMDVTLTIRAGRPTEKLEITERKAGGTLRTVMIRGMLDSKGQLIFADQTFTESETGKLAAWLDELRTYGAQGNPEGRPAWGLTKEQFGVIHSALKKPLAFEPNEMELSKVVEKLELPADIPLRFSLAAAKVLKEGAAPATVGQSLKGVSQGTALAVMLNDQGLVFRPRRLPDATIELTVTTAEGGGKVWPVGWPRMQSRPETAPSLFEFKVIDLDEEPLDGILEAASGLIGIPILIDRPAVHSKGIDLAEVKISHPRKKTTWITALESFTFKAKAKFEVLIDESGKPFLWVTPLAAPPREQKD